MPIAIYYPALYTPYYPWAPSNPEYYTMVWSPPDPWPPVPPVGYTLYGYSGNSPIWFKSVGEESGPGYRADKMVPFAPGDDLYNQQGYYNNYIGYPVPGAPYATFYYLCRAYAGYPPIAASSAVIADYTIALRNSATGFVDTVIAPINFPSDFPLTPAVKYPLIYALEGTGDVVVVPSSGSEYDAGEVVDYSATPLDANTIIDSITVVGAASYTSTQITMGSSSVTITVISHHVTPGKYNLSGSLTVLPSDCPYGMIGGGTVFFGQSDGILGIDSPGTTSGSIEVTEGESAGVSCSVGNMSQYVQSFKVDGAELTSNVTPGLADEFYVDNQPNPHALNDYFWFDMPPRDVSFAIVIAGDRFCLPGVPTLPPGLPNQPGGGGKPIEPGPGGLPDPRFKEPPVDPTDETPDDPFVDPGDQGNPGGGGDGGGNGGGMGGGAGGYGGGGNNADGTPYDPSHNPPNFRGVDWSHRQRGLLVRWQDQNDGWSKYHVVDLGLQGDTRLRRRIGPMGNYRVRQYEIVHVDGIPCTICYLEESLVGLDSTQGE